MARGGAMEDHWPHVFASCAVVVALVVFTQLMWRSSYTAESLLENVDVPEILQQHNKEFDVPEVVEVTDGVYMAIGFGLANSILLEAPGGAIIIDTMESVEAARDVMAAFRKVTSSKIKAIIYTHGHPDHVNGATVFAEEDPNHPPEVWAHHTLPQFMETQSFKNNVMYTRGLRQFGPLLPLGAHINSGIGPRLRLSTLGYIFPTNFLYAEEQNVTIAGLDLKLVHIPGETTDQMGVWLPEKGAFMCGDDVYKTFPNLYAIRGTPSRNVLLWVDSIDKIRALSPRFIVPSHTRHLQGQDFIRNTLTDYRDAIQYIHDQTLRYMNKGYFPEDIVPLVKLPDKLADNPWLYELYGTAEWSVKAVFDQYMGWFSGNVADLRSVPSKERASKMVHLGGGVRAVCNKAKDVLKGGDPQWALELSTHALDVSPGDTSCKEIRLESLKTLASQQTSPNGRNYYLTVALEDYGLVSTKVTPYMRMKGIVAKTANELMQILRTKLIAENCLDFQTVAVFNFTDTKEVFTLTIRNGILHVQQEQEPTHWEVKVSVTLETWKDILVSVRSPLSAYISGDLKIQGGITALRAFMGNFEKE